MVAGMGDSARSRYDHRRYRCGVGPGIFARAFNKEPPGSSFRGCQMGTTWVAYPLLRVEKKGGKKRENQS